MKKFLALLSSLFVVSVLGRPEPPPLPNGKYGPPISTSEPIRDYGPPPAPQKYLPPSSPSSEPKPVYGPPKPVYGPPPAEKLITKNIYVHVPPEEPVEWSQSQPIRLPAPKKHYKIIFIKAPVPPSPTAPVIPLQPQDEHKTLVYVLVKKPDEQPPVHIPIPEPTEPSKPEVYFIKYKNANKPAPEYGPPKGPY